MAAPHYKTILAQQQEYLPDTQVLLDYISRPTRPLDPISSPASDYSSKVLQDNPLPSIGYSGLSGQKMRDMYTLMENHQLNLRGDHHLKKNLYEN